MDIENSCCIGCLSGYNQTSLHTYLIQNESLRQILEEDSLQLCNVCHGQALQVDKWVTTIQNNQLQLAQTQPHASRFKESTPKLIARAKCNEQPEILVPQSITNNSRLQSCDDISSGDPLANSYNGYDIKIEPEMVTIKEEIFSDNDRSDTEEIFPNKKIQIVINSDSKKEGRTEKIETKRTPQKRKVTKEEKSAKIIKNKRKIEEENYDLEETENEKRHGMYEVVKITKEQCLEEMAASAKDPKYLQTAFRCEHCVKGYILKSVYEEHMKLHDPSRGEHVCDICKVRYATMKAVCNHVRKHFVKAKCRECDFVRKNPSSIVEHYQKEHKKLTNDCELCGKKLATLKSLKRHQQYVHTGVSAQERISCKYCSNTFKCKYILKNHVTSMHTELVSAAHFDIRRHKCPTCSRGFTVPSRLKRHIEQAHTDIRDFYCKQCDKFFKSKYSLLAHEKSDPAHVHKTKFPFQCDHCGRRFKRKIHTQKHIVALHPLAAKVPLPLLTCTLCNKEYKGDQGLHFHMRAAHGQGLQRKHRPKEQHECQFCYKTFMEQISVQGHQHTEKENSGEKWLNNHIRKTHDSNWVGPVEETGVAAATGAGLNPADMVETQLGAE